MTELKGKKLLILGGSYQHRKIVQTARRLGIETYVTDYLPIDLSPAKPMADHALSIDIFDYKNLVDLCRKEKIDAVSAPYLDVTQWPVFYLCEAMGYPCFGNYLQHKILTDKRAFKQFCDESGADTIPGYSREQLETGEAPFPLLIKPADSRGSRGQTVCFRQEDVAAALQLAERESHDGGVLIERYMGKRNDVQLVYLVMDGEPFLYKVQDRFLGSAQNGLDKLCIAEITPSSRDEAFRKNADQKVKNMIRRLGLKNAPVFIQAFFDGDTAWLYDPGLRMPGDDFDDTFKENTGIDIAEILVRFAFTGEMPKEIGQSIENTRLHRYGAMVFPCLRPGVIAGIEGLEAVQSLPSLVSFSTAYRVGDEVLAHHNVKQRFGEFVFTARDRSDLSEQISYILNTLRVYDAAGDDMLIEKFDVKELSRYAW